MRRLLLLLLLPLLLLAAGTTSGGGWDGHCYSDQCPVVPLRALVVKYPIRWCFRGDIPAGDQAYATLADPWGWSGTLEELGVEMIDACAPEDLTSVWVQMGTLSPKYAGMVNYSGLTYIDGAGWTAGVCTITINDMPTTNPYEAIYWDTSTPEGRATIINHEFGHCLGFMDGEPDLMNYDTDWQFQRPSDRNREALRERFPYADPAWVECR